MNLDTARCLTCDYPLRGLRDARCPECGRTFDPADAKSVNLAKPLGYWGRRILHPSDATIYLLPLVATAILIWISGRPRWPAVPPQLLAAELRGTRQSWLPLPPRTFADQLLRVSLWIWIAFFILLTLRVVLRWTVRKYLGQPRRPWRSIRRRASILLAAVATSAIFITFGWQGRIATEWLNQARSLANTKSPWGPYYYADLPYELGQSQKLSVLRLMLDQARSASDRKLAWGLSLEYQPQAVKSDLVRTIDHEPDAGLRATAIRVLSLYRDPATRDALIAHLADPDADCRAAAADAVGILRNPSYPIVVHDGFWIVDPPQTETQPPLPVGGIFGQKYPEGSYGLNGNFTNTTLSSEPPIVLPDDVRPRLESMMLHAATPAEREAAARTLVEWPPSNYRLRVAEWGVWLCHNGDYKLAQSVLDEIPPFVHRTGDPPRAFADYFLYPSMVTKPIIHFTASAPLAVDFEVQIRRGRPWFAFPLPDDFTLATGGDTAFFRPRIPNRFISTDLLPLADPGAVPLPAPSEGYPWLRPHHRMLGLDGRWGTTSPLRFASRIGLRWQSLIVSPSKLEWMRPPPPVPANAKFGWWSRLRDVPTSWVCSRNESERFLYYDGPTLMKCPVVVTASDQSLRIAMPLDDRIDPSEPLSAGRSMPGDCPPMQPLAQRPAVGRTERAGLYIEVVHGAVTGQLVPITGEQTIPLQSPAPLKGDQVPAALLRLLTDYGLTPAEARALMDSWKKQFFETDGRRFILRMSPEDYDTLCPLQMRPTPTELVRLGLVYTQL